MLILRIRHGIGNVNPFKGALVYFNALFGVIMQIKVYLVDGDLHFFCTNIYRMK